MVSSFAPAEPISLYAFLHPRKGKSQCVVSSSAPADFNRNIETFTVIETLKGCLLCVASSSAPAELLRIDQHQGSSFFESSVSP